MCGGVGSSSSGIQGRQYTWACALMVGVFLEASYSWVDEGMVRLLDGCRFIGIVLVWFRLVNFSELMSVVSTSDIDILFDRIVISICV